MIKGVSLGGSTRYWARCLSSSFEHSENLPALSIANRKRHCCSNRDSTVCRNSLDASNRAVENDWALEVLIGLECGSCRSEVLLKTPHDCLADVDAGLRLDLVFFGFTRR
jgi:hypothetical protein